MNSYLKNAIENNVLFSSTFLYLKYKLGLISKYTCEKNQMECIFNKNRKRILKKYKLNDLSFDENWSSNIESTSIIWIFWYQEEMPDIVKKCYETICKYSNGYQVILLNKNNIEDFYKIPNEIKNKLEDKSLSIQMFSDVLRYYLLFTYGGVWIDATCCLLKNIPEFILNSDTFFFKSGYSKSEFPNYQSWFLVSKKDNPLFKMAYEILMNEILNKKKLHYFHSFFILQTLLEKLENVYDNVLYLNENNYYVVQKSKTKLSDNMIEQIKENTFLQKLTYKGNVDMINDFLDKIK